MMHKTLSTPVPLILLLLIFSGTSSSQTQDDQLFEVELIAFTHLNPHDSGEQWPAPAHPYRDGRVQKPITQNDQQSETGPSLAFGGRTGTAPERDQESIHGEFKQLVDTELKLGGLAARLRRKQLAERVLLHTGWRQKIKPANATVPVLIEGGFPLAEVTNRWHSPAVQQDQTRGADLAALSPLLPKTDPRISNADSATTNAGAFAGKFELEGTLAFYETRYPRLETNLCLTITAKSGSPLIMDQPTTLPATPEVVCSREIRGLKYGDLLYFDTPVLGLLAQVRRVTTPTQSARNQADP
jgi:hypothetical protein